MVLGHYKHSGSSSFLSLLTKKMLTVTGIFSPPDPHSLALRCLVNGELVQRSNTDQMIFKTEALVSWVSKYVPLNPLCFFPCPWWLCWVCFFLDSQSHFVSFKTNFLYPSTETLDDCGLRKYANRCLMLFFKRSIVPANGWNASSETQQGCHRRGHYIWDEWLGGCSISHLT